MRRVGAFFLVVVGLAFVVYLLSGQEDRAAEPVFPTEGLDLHSVLLMDVDEHGALVREDGALRGVNRNGTIAWQDDAKSPASNANAIICAGTCPHSVSSGDGDPLANDPAPTTHGKVTLPPQWLEQTGGGNVILATDGTDALRVVSDGQNPAHLESNHAGTTKQFPMDGPSAQWDSYTGPGATAGSLFNDAGDEERNYLATRSARGWTVREVPGWRACIDTTGKRTVIGHTLTVGAKKIDLPAKTGELLCSFTPSGVVFHKAGSEESSADFYHNNGTLKWSQPVRNADLVLVDPAHDRIAILDTTTTASTLTLFDGTGKKTKTYPGVMSAAFTDKGTLVTADTNATVTWHGKP